MKNIKNIKSFTAIIGILGLVGALVSSVALAASTGDVVATVTVANISVSVVDGTIAYGTLASNTSSAYAAGDNQVATNDGNVTEVFNIKAVEPAADWTIGGTPASNVYVQKFCKVTCTNPPTNYTALTTSYQTLAASVAANGTQAFDVNFTTPNPSTVFTQKNVNVTVQATAL